MLVLSRLPMQALLIGEEIEVRVLRVSRGGEVRFGLTAPRDVAILRGELLDRPADHPSRHPKLKKSSARRRSPRWQSGNCGGGDYPPADGGRRAADCGLLGEEANSIQRQPAQRSRRRLREQYVAIASYIHAGR
ncbi:carbon storage regulator [Lysobacter sp. CA199]|uniref:carbon storage regulator n=1 Tax=Lysobacter sp. CA199 TaxID=3455608 RepID=UPI003F8CF609